MNTESIIKTLIEREGYSKPQAILVTKELNNLEDRLKPLFEHWLSTGNQQDYCMNNVRISQLMSELNMQYPAALLTIDWIIKEPDISLSVVNRMLTPIQ